jgi:hypothetical protein
VVDKVWHDTITSNHMTYIAGPFNNFNHALLIHNNYTTHGTIRRFSVVTNHNTEPKTYYVVEHNLWHPVIEPPDPQFFRDAVFERMIQKMGVPKRVFIGDPT